MLRSSSSKVINHASGRPWLLGNWTDRRITVAAAGTERLAVIGRCPVTAGELEVRLGRIRSVDDVQPAIGDLTGSFHAVASVGGRVWLRGSASGVRQVFHASLDGVTVAANRADVLASWVGSRPDEQVLALHLLYGSPPYPLDDKCLWQGVHIVRPGDCLTVESDGRSRTRRWWNPPEPELSPTEGAPAVRSALIAAVKSCVSPGGTVSCDLSGGMDSTSLCFLASRSRSRLVTLHWEGLGPGNDDARWSAAAAAALPHCAHVRPDPSHTPPWFGAATEPLPDAEEPGALAPRETDRLRAAVALMISHGSRLHMTGCGGDELFTAYFPHMHDYVRTHPLAALSRLRRQRLFLGWPLRPLLRGLVDRSSFSQWLAARADGLAAAPPAPQGRPLPSMTWGDGLRMPPWATPDAVHAVRRMLREAADAGTEPLSPQRGQHAALSYLRTAGRVARQRNQTTAALGLEYADPYLDDNVVESALSIRVAERNAREQYKPVLATAMRGTVPDALLERSTKGDFSTDMYRGLQHGRAGLLSLVDESRLAEVGLIDAAAFRTALSRLGPTSDAPRLFEAALGCELWLRSLSRHAAGR